MPPHFYKKEMLKMINSVKERMFKTVPQLEITDDLIVNVKTDKRNILIAKQNIQENSTIETVEDYDRQMEIVKNTIESFVSEEDYKSICKLDLEDDALIELMTALLITSQRLDLEETEQKKILK